MHITFERTGGFAGMRLAVTIDTHQLSPEEAKELEEMVEAAGFFDLPAKISSESPGADRFHYKLTVEAEGQRHTVELGEAAAPEPLRTLLRRLTTVARSVQRS
jgi:hypothetical protein